MLHLIFDCLYDNYLIRRIIIVFVFIAMDGDDFGAIHPDRVRKVELREKRKGEEKWSGMSEIVDEVRPEMFQKNAVTYLEFLKKSPLLKPKSSLNKVHIFEDE